MKEYHLRPQTGALFRIDYEKELNPRQLEVVTAGDGPLLVIAGAGSGKTRAVTYRVARLIESGVPPAQVLLLTFTNKAAREMLRRVEALTGGEARVTGGTFHHVGNLVIRRHAEILGYRPNFTILDREDARDLLHDVLGRSRLVAECKTAPKPDVLLEIWSYSVNTGRPFEKVLAERHAVFADVEGELVRCLNEYRHRKRELNLLDFDDLLTGWRELVARHPEVREAQHERWRHILVDEYQDTNLLQAEIVERIAGENGNLMVVGDDAQSIYSFRGANFGNIIDFPKRFPSCRVFKLETNYRSVPEVLALANSSIANNRRQFPKTLHASRAPGVRPEIVTCGEVEDQARFVAQRALELRDEGMDFRDVAVLYRAHWHSMELQMELTRLGIPFVVRSGLRFFEQAHVKDVAAVLRIMDNPLDEISWKRVLRLYPRIGAATAERIWEALRDSGTAFRSDAVLRAVPSGARRGWGELVALLEKLGAEAMRKSPSEMIRAVVDGGYENYLAATYTNFHARIDDLRRLADFALRYEGLDAFLSELALSNTVAGREAVEEGEEGDALVLSTIHQAKGLEWRAVFLIWACEGKIPDARAVKEEGGEEEERRLFYVAVTRAKDQLYLVRPIVADERNLFGVIQRPSRFLEELDRATFEETRVGYGSY
ncbi:MAG: ATP-dependent helicase [Planctomycetes bacterium]|nr:ATP-dependent helicase [Planctomycetota bacterium]